MNMFVRLSVRFWRPALAALGIALLSYLLFFHNLTHLLPGYADREIATYNSSTSLRAIVDDPLNAPYKLVLYVILQLGHHSLLTTRVTAAAFAVGAAVLFFVIARHWFRYRVALLATLMFASSAGFLHLARLGSPLVLQMSLLLLVAVLIWRRHAESNRLLGYGLIAMLAALWYVPGMIWFELLTALFLFKPLRRSITRLSLMARLVYGGLFLLVLLPLVRAIILEPSSALGFAGLPAHFASPLQILHSLGNALLAIGLYAQGQPDLRLGHLPLLNAIELVLLLLGAYVLGRRLARTWGWYILAAALLCVLLTALGGPIGTSSGLLPLLYLIIAAGVHELLRRWLYVFPRNPFARFAGIFCIVLLVGFSVLYHCRAYFVAWPHSNATRETFTHQRV